MSSGTAVIRFPDGSVRYGIYHGTSDVMSRDLFATVKLAWDNKSAPQREIERPDDETLYDVEIYTDYGGGFHWGGTATKGHIDEGISPWGEEDSYGNKFMLPRTPRIDGEPSWLIAEMLTYEPTP